jgi:hypothetical protein
MGNEPDMEKIIASLDSYHIDTTAHVTPDKHASPAIDSSEHFSGTSRIGVSPRFPPKDPILLSENNAKNESHHRTDLTNCTVSLFSKGAPETSIWSRLAGNTPTSAGAVFTPGKSPLDRPLIVSHVERPTSSVLATPFKPYRPSVVPGAQFPLPMTPPKTISRQSRISTEPASTVSTNFGKFISMTKQDASSATPRQLRPSSGQFQNPSAVCKDIFEPIKTSSTLFAASSGLSTPSSGLFLPLSRLLEGDNVEIRKTASPEIVLFESIPAEIERSHGRDPETASREIEIFETAASTDDPLETEPDVLEPEIYEFLPELTEKSVGEEPADTSSSVSRPISIQVPVCRTADRDAQKSPSEEIVVSIDEVSAACGHKSIETFSYPLLIFRRESTESADLETSESERCFDEETTCFQSRTSDAEDNEIRDGRFDRSDVKVLKPENSDHSKVDDTKKDQDELYDLSASDDDDSGGYEIELEVHSKTNNESGDDEESNSTNESGTESGSDQEDSEVETSSDDERSASSSRHDLLHLSEEDQCWLHGLGSLTGYQLATASYLRTLFMSRTSNMQVDMIQEVVGDGPMKGDRYRFNDQDLLRELLKDLNAHIPDYTCITKRMFRRSLAIDAIGVAVSSMVHRRVTHEDRWNCFKFALSIRSRRECSRILCTEAFDFTTEEWQWLEWSAKW